MILKISTEIEYEQVIEQVEALWDADPGTPEAQARDYLLGLIEAYEGGVDIMDGQLEDRVRA